MLKRQIVHPSISLYPTSILVEYFRGLVSDYKNKHRIQIHISMIFRPIAFQWCIVCYGFNKNNSSYKWCKNSLFQVKPRFKSNSRMVDHYFRNEEIKPGHSAATQNSEYL